MKSGCFNFGNFRAEKLGKIRVLTITGTIDNFWRKSREKLVFIRVLTGFFVNDVLMGFLDDEEWWERSGRWSVMVKIFFREEYDKILGA